jgi:hypothetical protein
MMTNDKPVTPPWLKAHVDALKPTNMTMKAVEVAARVMQAQRERDIRADMDLQRWLRT